MEITRISIVPAYLDPTSGSMALQIAIGGTLAAVATVRTYWQKLRSLFRHELKTAARAGGNAVSAKNAGA